jgi:hypothetical protein
VKFPLVLAAVAASLGVAGAADRPVVIGAIYNLTGQQNLDIPSSRGARVLRSISPMRAAGFSAARRP